MSPVVTPIPMASGVTLGPLSTNASPGTVVTTNNVVYVRKTGGSDLNTGANMAEGFQHVSYAYTFVNALGGGTIIAEDGAFANPVSGCGVLLRGDYDTGIGGSGWTSLGNLGGINIEIVPVAGGQFSAAQGSLSVVGGTWLTPMLWLTGIHYGQLTFTNWQLAMPLGSIPALRAGISSPLPAWAIGTTYAADAQISYGGASYLSLVGGNVGHQPDISPSQWVSTGRPDNLGTAFCQGIQFNNCTVQNLNPNTGPAGDFGFTFWFWWNQSVFAHGSPAPIGGDISTNCAMRYLASPSVALGVTGSYLHQFRDCRMAGAGFYSNGACSLNVEHMVGEAMDYPGWYADITTGLGQAQGYLNDFQTTDSTEPRALVNNGTNVIKAINCSACDGPVSIDTYTSTGALISNPVASGIMGPTAFNEIDHARALFGPSAAPYPNTTRDPSGFATTTGPDGLATSGYTATGDYKFFTGFPSTGDAFAVGVWVKSSAANDGLFQLVNVGNANATMTLSSRGPITLVPAPTAGCSSTLYDQRPWAANEWVWLSGWVKFTSLAGTRGIDIQIRNGIGVFSKPWCIYVPAADNVPVSQIARWARYGACTPAAWDAGHTVHSPASGSASLWPGQPLGFWDASLAKWSSSLIDGGAWTGLRAITGMRTGADLTNADVTKNPAFDAASAYTLPAATLTAGHTLTLGVTGSPITGAVVQVVRRDLTGFTYTVKDDAGTTLYTFGATPSSAQMVTCRYNGTHYEFVSFAYVP